MRRDIVTGQTVQALPQFATDFASVELRETFEDLFGSVRPISQQRLSWRHHVHRMQVDVGGTSRSLVLKRFSSSQIAQRNQMVVTRWLPAVGLARAVPTLLGIAAERDGKHVWHIYEDLGECSLAVKEPPTEDRGPRHSRHAPRVFHVSPDRVHAAVRIIAEVHARFTEHPLLGECRLYGSDFGEHFFSSALRDAIRTLELLLTPERELSSSRMESLQHLLVTLRRLLSEAPARAAAMTRFGGPETLLHGDLWPINVMVYPDGVSLRGCLVDWDHVGVGSVSYDLSNFLGHLPPEDRQWVLQEYLQCMERIGGWRFPRETDWNLLCDTAERSRLATSAFWRAMTALDNPSDWALDDLAAVDEWLVMVEPIFPAGSAESEVQR